MDFTSHINFMFQRMGRPAVYTPDGGAPVNVMVIAKRPDEIDELSGSQFITGTTLLDVRKTEIPGPQKGGRIELDGQVYTILSDPVSRDPDRLIWTLSVIPA